MLEEKTITPPPLQQQQQSSYFRDELKRLGSTTLDEYVAKLFDPNFGDAGKFNIYIPKTNNPDDQIFYNFFSVLRNKAVEKCSDSEYDKFLKHYKILPPSKQSYKNVQPSELLLFDAFFNIPGIGNYISSLIPGNNASDAIKTVVCGHLGSIPQGLALFNVKFSQIQPEFNAENVLKTSCPPGCYYASFCCLHALNKRIYTVVVDSNCKDVMVNNLRRNSGEITEFVNPVYCVAHFLPNSNWVDFVKDLRATAPPFWMSIYDKGANGIDINIVYTDKGFQQLQKKKIYASFASLAKPVKDFNGFINTGNRVPLESILQYPEKSTDICPEGNSCTIIDQSHLDGFDHHHKTDICRNIFCNDPGCRANRTHICSNGSRCQGISDQNHCNTNIHIKSTCPNGPGCNNPDARHRMAYHGNIVGFCNIQGCRDPNHAREFIHVPSMLNRTSYNELDAIDVDVDANLNQWAGGTRQFAGQNPNLGDIPRWIGNMRPVIRCSVGKLVSMIKLGAFTSIGVLSNMFRNPDPMVELFFMNPKNAGKVISISNIERECIVLSLKKAIAEYTSHAIGDLGQRAGNGEVKSLGIELFNYSIRSDGENDPQTFDDDGKLSQIQSMCSNSPNIRAINEIITDLKSCISNVGDTLLAAVDDGGIDLKNSTGSVTKKIFTANSVLAVLGPSMYSVDDGSDEVAIVLKPSILYHPDSFLTPIPAAHYGGDATSKYNSEKFCSSTRGWAEACACELIMRVSKKLGKNPADVSFDDVVNYWKDPKNGVAIEAHLPAMFSFDCVEQIFLKDSIVGNIGGNESQFLGAMSSSRGLSITNVPNTYEQTFGLFMSPSAIPHWEFPTSFSFDIPDKSRVKPIPKRIISDKAKISFDLVSPTNGVFVSLLFYNDRNPQPFMIVTIYHNKDGNTGSLECHNLINNDQVVARCPFASFMFSSRLEPFTLLLCGNRAVLYHSDFASEINKNFIFFILPVKCDYVAIHTNDPTPCTAWNFDISNNDPEAVPERLAMFDNLTRLCNPDSPPPPPPQNGVNPNQPNFNPNPGFNPNYNPNHPPPPQNNGNYNQPGFNPNTPPPPQNNGNYNQPGFNPNPPSPPPPQNNGNYNQPNPNFNGNHGPSPTRSYAPGSQQQNQQQTHQLRGSQTTANMRYGNSSPPPSMQQNQLRKAQSSAQVSVSHRPPMSSDGRQYCDSYLMDCKNTDPDHFDKFAHVCRYGKSCKDFGDPDHAKKYIHLDKQLCPNGGQCTNLKDPQHRADYHHPGKWDYLVPCMNGTGCSIKTDKHLLCYQHINPPMLPNFP